MPALEVHVLLDLFRDADHLALVHGGGDHHDVGDGEQVADIERLDVGGFHAVGRDCGDAHGINGTLGLLSLDQRSQAGFQPSTMCCAFSE